MDLLNRIDILLQDELATGATITPNVEPNLSKGNVDIVGGDCPKGEVYDKKRKVCVPAMSRGSSQKSESSVVGGSYVGGTTNIAGSGQTRIWGERRRYIDDLDRKEPVERKYFDKAKENIEGRIGIKFNSLLGAYLPRKDTHIEGEA